MDDRAAAGDDPFSARLLRGEKILWRGRPKQGLMLTGQDFLLIPFSLIWGGFALFWEAAVLSAPKAPVFMALFGIPFVLVGLFFIFGRFFADAWIRGGIFYALTDRRALILRSRPFANFQSLSLDRLGDLTWKEMSGGRGAIRFGPQIRINRGFGGLMPSLDPLPQFLAIEDASRVFALIQERART